MKIKLITAVLFFLFTINLSAQDNTIIIQENMNLRALESTTSQILDKLPQLSKVIMLSEGKSEVVNGISDQWYKVETDKNKIGFVFGHYTSLKKEGQRKVIATFTDCSMGDLYHLEFDNGTYDFGGAQNNLGKFELCIGDDMDVTGNPKYINKKFELIINNLVSRVCCDPSCEEVCTENVPTIVTIKQVTE